ncbi:hypothetical protein B0O80DRAFT_247610 [Mortierella sp. GBAus27b]|nr:hypothetical protein B0O80DRAFT_247610 [Mortierella sp. GBAus27b]
MSTDDMRSTRTSRSNNMEDGIAKNHGFPRIGRLCGRDDVVQWEGHGNTTSNGKRYQLMGKDQSTGLTVHAENEIGVHE